MSHASKRLLPFSHRKEFIRMSKLSSRYIKPGFVFLLSLILIACFWTPLGRAQSSKQSNADFPPWIVKKSGHANAFEKTQPIDTSVLTERVIDDMIPFHVPIKVELQNLDAENLLDHIVIKVTNISKKPIYYLALSIDLPDVMSSRGIPYTFG